ncbi:MAG: sialidase family protein [Candidatus Krumholzibacteriia bacterium]
MVSGTMGRNGRIGILGVALVLTLAAAAAAQPTSCELPLTVPATSEITYELRSTSRGPGLFLTWPEPNDALSTCVALVDTAGLGIPMRIDGDYLDSVDRTLEFRFTTGGAVGDAARNRMVCAWSNVNNVRTGNLNGEINLSNTGGLWSQTGSAWTQWNEGLPYSLPYTNLIALSRAADGTRLAALTAGAWPQVQNDPVGVYLATAGGDWTEIGAALFGRARGVAAVAVDPDAAANLAVGTRRDGVFISTDGGATFTQWTSNLDPSAPNIPNSFEVTAITWTGTRLYVAVRNFGLFISADGGASFTRAAALEVPSAPGSSTLVRPVINTIVEDPSLASRVLVGLTTHGVWESLDGGTTWQSIYVDYAGSDPGWAVSVRSLAIDPLAGQHLTAGTVAQLIQRTVDGGATWTAAVTPYDGLAIKPQIWSVVYHGATLLALADAYGILTTADAGASWSLLADQPYNRLGRQLLSDGTVLDLATTGGGIYTPGLPVSLTSTILSSGTDSNLRSLALGLDLTFFPGSLTLADENNDGALDPRIFRIICQDYQGWIVWRSPRGNPDAMVMIGRYDKSNPETCIEGFCGDENFVIRPNCFDERRAACFEFDGAGNVSFYDDDVFNGFTYQYAVTPFDFGDISLVIDPVAVSSPMVFPNRYPGDDVGVDDGPGNRFSVQVNTEAAAELDGEEIYVYPNPLRLGAGIVGGEGEEVVWTNLPPESRIQIFTLAGDEIAELPRDGSPQVGANMYWVARNNDRKLLASGIYIWRVLMPARGDYWGKLVIIN